MSESDNLNETSLEIVQSDDQKSEQLETNVAEQKNQEEANDNMQVVILQFPNNVLIPMPLSNFDDPSPTLFYNLLSETQSIQPIAHYCEVEFSFQWKHLQFSDFPFPEEFLQNVKHMDLIVLHPMKYNSRSIKNHISCIRKLISAQLVDPFSNSHASKQYIRRFFEKHAILTMSDANAGRRGKLSYIDFEDCKPSDYVQQFAPLSNNRCLDTIEFSSWNPPPSYRVLHGDLIYLVVKTLEGHRYHITGNLKGFFRNNSTDDVFDGSPHAHHCAAQNLADHLALLSASFKAKFLPLATSVVAKSSSNDAAALGTNLSDSDSNRQHGSSNKKKKNAAKKNSSASKSQPPSSDKSSTILSDSGSPEENIKNLLAKQRLVLIDDVYSESGFPHYPLPSLVAPNARHSSDAYRSENSQFLLPFPDTIPENFNEFWQKAHAENVASLFLKDHSKMAAYSLFFKKAYSCLRNLLGGAFVTTDSYASIQDVIFMYSATRATCLCSISDVHASQIISQECQFDSMLSSSDFTEFAPILSACFDYAGHRVSAQALIPGTTNLTGSFVHSFELTDKGVWNEQIHEKLSFLKQFNIKEHDVTCPVTGKIKKAYSCHLKCYKGTDGRLYLGDTWGLLPVDTNFFAPLSKDLLLDLTTTDTPLVKFVPSDMHSKDGFLYKSVISSWCTLRRELIISFTSSQQSAHLRAKMNERRKAAKEGNPDQEEQISVSKDELTAWIEEIETLYNPDAFNKVFCPDQAATKSDRQYLQDMSTYLLTISIPSLILELGRTALFETSENEELSFLLHNRGINLRYLGYIYSTVKDTKFSLPKRKERLLSRFANEMLLRTTKRVLRYFMKKVTSCEMAYTVSTFFNAFFGHSFEKVDTVDSIFDSLENSSATDLGISTQLVWQHILDDMKYHFQVDFSVEQSIDTDSEAKKSDLPNASFADFSSRFKIFPYPFFFALCKMCGIQLFAKDFNIGKKLDEPLFFKKDIANVYPTYKKNYPSSELYHYSLSQLPSFKENAQAYRNYNYSLFETLTNIGFGLSDAACKVLQNIIMACRELEDVENELKMKQKLTTCAERMHGIDSTRTILRLVSLGISLPNPYEAIEVLQFCRKSLFLICGPHHYAHALILVSLTEILFSIGELDLVIKYGLEAEVIIDDLATSKLDELSNIYFYLKLAYEEKEDLLKVIEYSQKHVYSLEFLVGKDSDIYKESLDMLVKYISLYETLTQPREGVAPQIAKPMLKSSAPAPSERLTKSKKPITKPSTEQPQQQSTFNIASQDIDSLVNFINGQPKSNGKKKK